MYHLIPRHKALNKTIKAIYLKRSLWFRHTEHTVWALYSHTNTSLHYNPCRPGNGIKKKIYDAHAMPANSSRIIVLIEQGCAAPIFFINFRQRENACVRNLNTQTFIILNIDKTCASQFKIMS